MDTVSLVTELISRAQESGASDIHIDPAAHAVEIRVRVDGALRTSGSIPRERHAALIAHLKILASLRTDEHAAPQDGRFTFEAGTLPPLEVRISVMPTYYGENAVLRLFPFSTKALTLASLGMRREHARTVADAIARPHGLLLIAGPTGSGKTTTLYTLMEMLSAAAERPRMLVSIEDPVERPLAGVRQISAGVRDLSFARGLRAILRQDPDVIMVGEIRDTETAQLAVQAALTGHLVLSTLHALDIPAIVPRLTALGVDPYLAASTLRIALSERLVRTACDGCSSVRELTAAQLRSLSQLSESQVPLPIAHRIGSGCGSCDGTGYRGRTGVFDVAVGDGRPSKGELAFLERPSRLPRESVRKVAEGSTTCEEALRIGYA